MSDTLSSDLASLKIDRGPGNGARGGGSSSNKSTSSGARRGRGPLVTIVVIVVLLVVAFFGYQAAQPYLEAQLFKTEVDVTEIGVVSPAQASIELTSTGYVVPQVRSQVGAKLPGRVSKIYVREGDHVTLGQVLMELDRVDQVAAMQSARMRAAAARARVSTARANVDETRRQAERQRALSKIGAAASATADDLSSRASALEEQVKSVEAEVAAADAEVNALKINLDHMTVISPLDGVVMNKPPEPGELVGYDMGTGMGGSIELVDFKSILVETDVPETRLHLIKMGSPTEIVLDAYPDKRFRGEALEIMPRVNRAKATVGVKVKFVDDATGVLPDMSARVSFLTQALDQKALQDKPKIVVPASAIVERSGSKVVFVIDGEVARMRTVTLGPSFGDGFELISGPAPGTKLIKAPTATVLDGNKIKERNAS